MSLKKLVIHETEGAIVPDICGIAVELINEETAGAIKVSFAKLIIKAGESSRRHYHEETEEIYYILSGTAKVIIGNEIFNVRAGHAILLPIGIQHQIINTSQQDLIFVCAYAPVFEPDDVIEV